MAEHHTPAPVSQEDIDRAQTMWETFTKLLKVSVICTILLLIGMALFLL